MVNSYIAITEDQASSYFITTTRKLSDPEFILLESFEKPRLDLPPIFKKYEKCFGNMPPFRVESQLLGAYATESEDYLQC